VQRIHDFSKGLNLLDRFDRGKDSGFHDFMFVVTLCLFKDACDGSGKENVENSNQYTPAPFRVIGGLHLKSSKPEIASKESPQKQLSMAQRIMKNVEQTATQKYSQEETIKNQKLKVIQKEVDTSVLAEVVEEEKEAAIAAAAAASKAAAQQNTIIPPVEVTIMDETFEEGEIFTQTTTASADTASTNASSATVITTQNAIVHKRALKNNLMDYLLFILNEGTYEQLTALKGIGKVRAMKIFTERNAGNAFEHIDDLENIDMNEKAIQKFVQQNLGMMMFP
jgi:DNA uptake protein ComE-like DNA-binding protein